MVIRPDDVRRALSRVDRPTLDVRPLMGPDVRDAAVLVPLTFDRGPWPIANLLVRSADLRDHAGEVGFPGGKVEPGETLEEAAVREAAEEVGVRPADVEILGRLGAVPVVTGRYLIHPFVAAVPGPLRITSTEHAHLYEESLGRWLEAGEIVETTEAPWRGLSLVVPHFRIGEHVLYGASAVVLFELLSRLSPSPLPTRPVASRPWGDRYVAEEASG